MRFWKFNKYIWSETEFTAV